MMRALVLLALVTLAQTVHAAVDVADQIPLDALMANVPAGAGLKVGVVMRPPPAGFPAGAPEDIRDSTVAALRKHPGVLDVAVPSDVGNATDKDLAQEAGAAGMQRILVLRFEREPMDRAVWSVFDATGALVVLEERTLAQLAGTPSPSVAPPASDPDPSSYQANDDPPEEVETAPSGNAWTNPITLLILLTGIGGGGLAGVLTLVLFAGAAAALVLGPVLAPDAVRTATSAGQAMVALALVSACCCFCLPISSLCAAGLRSVPMGGPASAGPPSQQGGSTTVIIQQPPPSSSGGSWEDDRRGSTAPSPAPSRPRLAPSRPNPSHQPPPSNHQPAPAPAPAPPPAKKKTDDDDKKKKATPTLEKKVGTPGLKK